jgi:ubiquinone/menaquinone biosynthesis C-methylase UbiE
MVRLSQSEVDAAGLSNVQLIHGGAGEGLLEPGAFDRALLVTVLGEIPRRETALQEIYGALVPGGLLSITEIFPDPHYQPRRTVRRLALAAGFQEQQAYGSWLAFTLNFCKPGGSTKEVGHA